MSIQRIQTGPNQPTSRVRVRRHNASPTDYLRRRQHETWRTRIARSYYAKSRKRSRKKIQEKSQKKHPRALYNTREMRIIYYYTLARSCDRINIKMHGSGVYGSFRIEDASSWDACRLADTFPSPLIKAIKKLNLKTYWKINSPPPAPVVLKTKRQQTRFRQNNDDNQKKKFQVKIKFKQKI